MSEYIWRVVVPLLPVWGLWCASVYWPKHFTIGSACLATVITLVILHTVFVIGKSS